MAHGRVLARDGDTLRVRGEAGEELLSPPGDARPGDLIRWESGTDPEVVHRHPQPDSYPSLQCEVARMTSARREGLRARARALAAIRSFFSEREFLEIEAPTLVPAPGMEVHIEAIRAGEGYLITSPEFALKRLLVGGLERIYAMPRCFRAEEEGRHHSVEFTMLEWYRAWSDLEAIARDTEELVAHCARTLSGGESVSVSGRAIDVSLPWARMTVAEAFERWVGIELSPGETAESLAIKLEGRGLELGTATAYDDLFYLAFVERIEPELEKLEHALLLVDWPMPLAALARRKVSGWAERFEAYVGGVELANAFGELTDAAEQRARFVEEQEERKRRGFSVYPIDEKFMAALEEGMPPSGGIALGVDRLVMLLHGAATIREVSAFVGEEL